MTIFISQNVLTMKKYFLSLIFILCTLFSLGQNRYDVIIDELMPDPTPVVGLPALEYIEIKNTTTANINLLGWRLTDATSQSGAIANYILKPDSFLIICSTGLLGQLSTFGPAISVTSFPSLDNDGDIISIKSNTGKLIHAVAYTNAWYQNVVKQDGGWSLEMIDTKNPCGGIDNWKASVSTTGGTPGVKNSIDAINADTKLPQLLRTYTNSPLQVVAVFNEPIDSTVAAVVANYQLSGLTITTAIPVAPTFQQVLLNLSTPLVTNTIYNLTVTNVADCKGNVIGSFNKARAGLPVDADSLDILINEILFNPKSNGFDFVELYNNSNKIFDANKLSIANKNTTGAIANVNKMSEQPCLIFPRDYIVLTENGTSIKQNFFVENPDALIEIPTMPSFNDDEGNVIFLNFQGKIVDAVNYKDDWHFKLIDNDEGISLERIDFNIASQNADSWHSAASSSNYGTPTAKNSQYRSNALNDREITLVPKIFSPDNDGLDDILSINYNLSERGQLANIIIYDASGVPVRRLKNNDLLGFKGTWVWDGLNDKNEKLATGIYVVWVEVYDTKGNRKQYKKSIVLARKLK
jgi:hypothetical protein